MNRSYRVAAGVTAIVLAMLIAVYLVVALRTLVVMVVVAGLFATAFDRPVSWVERRWKVRRSLATVLVLLAFLLVLVGFGYLAYQPFVHQTRVFRRGLPGVAGRVKKLPIAGHYLKHVDVAAVTQRFLKELPGKLAKNKNAILGVAQTALTGAALAVTTAVTMVFLLFHGPRLVAGAERLILDDFRRARARRLAAKMQQAVSGYVSGNLFISLLASLVTVISLLAMSVPFVAVLAATMFILDLIPLVGATLGGAVVTAAVFILVPQEWKALVFVAIYVVYQEIETHTLYPWIMGRTLRISSLGVFLVALAGAELGGVLGALIAIPIGAVINVVLQDILEERRNKAAAQGSATARLELAVSALRAKQAGAPEVAPPGPGAETGT